MVVPEAPRSVVDERGCRTLVVVQASSYSAGIPVEVHRSPVGDMSRSPVAPEALHILAGYSHYSLAVHHTADLRRTGLAAGTLAAGNPVASARLGCCSLVVVDCILDWDSHCLAAARNCYSSWQVGSDQVALCGR